MASDYSTYEIQRAPVWLRAPYGAGWLEAHGLVKDGLVEAARQAVVARFVTGAPSDALPYAASDRTLERMPPDTDATWRARLADAWNLWAWAGTRKGVKEAVERTGYFASVALYDYVEWPTGPDANGWPTFWIIASGGPWDDDGNWDDDGDYDDGGTWDTTATPQEVELVLRQVRLWKPPHAWCAGVLVLLDGTIWDPNDDPATLSAPYAPWLVETT
jgi:hypothetical protein